VADVKWVKLEELRKPGMRRLLEGMRLIEKEKPTLLDEASLAAAELANGRSHRWRFPNGDPACPF
jgi:hypothetical protein